MSAAAAFSRRATWLIALICVLGFLGTACIAFLVFERLPHLEDEIAYLFQAKTLALGRLTVPSPSQPGSFWTPFVLDHNGHRFGKYPPGWPAVLALGALVDLPWLVNPVLAAVALYLVYRLGDTLYDKPTGLLAAALGLVSPLFLVLGGSLLSHQATLVWLLLFSLWFVWTVQGRGARYAAGAGAALGMAFLTRSLTAAAYAAPFAVVALVRIVRRRDSLARYLPMIAVAGGVAALLPLYQWAVTGDPCLNPYTLWWPYDRLGFGPGIGAMPGGHSPRYAWINLKQDLSNAATDVFGWPWLSWLPPVLGLLLPARRGRDRWLAAPLLCLVFAYLFYWIGSPLRLWGPRYYFEGFGALWLLGAVGLRKAWRLIRDQESGIRRQKAAEPPLPWRSWLLAGGTAASAAVSLAITLPPRLADAHGLYGISRAQLCPIQEANLGRALVIVYAERWLEYGAMLGQMSPLLDDDIVYARGSGPETDAAVIADFPGRKVVYLKDGRIARTPP